MLVRLDIFRLVTGDWCGTSDTPSFATLTRRAAGQFEWKLACCGGVGRRGERAFTHVPIRINDKGYSSRDNEISTLRVNNE